MLGLVDVELERLKVELAGLKLKNPVMNASGVLGLTSYSLERIAKAGVGAVVTKSFGLNLREGNPNPIIVEIGCGLLNAVGLPNPGINEAIKELEEALERVETPIIVSVFGFSPEEYLEVVKRFEKIGVSAFELNVSCPHVEGVGEIGQNVEVLAETVKKVRSATKKPIFVKLSPNVSDIAEMARVVEEAGADAVTAINTVKAMIIDVETGKPILGGKVGGLSGSAIKPIAVRCVYEIFREVEIPIIGCGGISSWMDAVEFFMAGASAIQIGTAVIHRDLGVFGEVVEGLNRYLEKKNIKNIGEIVGFAHKS